MKKKLILVLILFIFIVTFAGCAKKDTEGTIKPTESSSAFKKDYEALNGKENKSGKVHRSVSIPEANPMEEISPAELLTKIDNGETFYVYFGSSLCPWCRSCIEKANEVANKKNIDKIYYIDIWDEEGHEILRDKYELNKKNKPTQVSEGAPEYARLLEVFDAYLSDYNLTDADGNKIPTGEKRIYAPNYFYVEKGVAKRKVEGYSSKQKDSRETLTEEMLKDEEKIFDEFFK
jgi:thiol-disulfide isomerase/thioredoxin